MHTKEQRLVMALKKDDTAALAKVIDGYAGYVCAVIRNFSRGAFTEEDIEDRVSKIKVSVLARAEGDEHMKKIFKFKPLVIAAVLAITASVMAVVTSAGGNGKTHYSVKINGQNVPYTVETVEEDIQYSLRWSDGIVPARRVEEIIKYEIPEEFVVAGGNRERAEVLGKIYMTGSDIKLESYSFTCDNSDKLPGVYCRIMELKNDSVTNTVKINIEYEFIAHNSPDLKLDLRM